MAFLQAFEEFQKIIAAECNNDALFATMLKEVSAEDVTTSVSDKINALYEDVELLESLAIKSGLLRLKIQAVLAMEDEKSKFLTVAEKNKLKPVFDISFALLVALTKAYPLNTRILKTDPPEYEDFITLSAFDDDDKEILTSEGVILSAQSLEQMITTNNFGYKNPLSGLPFGPRDVAYIKAQAKDASKSKTLDLERYDNMVQISLGLTIHMIMLFTALTFPLLTAFLLIGASFLVTGSVMALVSYLKPVTRIANYFNLATAKNESNPVETLLAFVPQHEPLPGASDEDENLARSENGVSENPEMASVSSAVPSFATNDSIQAPPAGLQFINGLNGARRDVGDVPEFERAGPRV